jgi:uncharacterized protein
MTPSPEQLNDMVQRILGVVRPVRIILFGSAARGDMRPDSDLDVLVVIGEGESPKEVEDALYMAMLGFGVPVDFVVATEETLREWGNLWATVYYPALREGRTLYAA